MIRFFFVICLSCCALGMAVSQEGPAVPNPIQGRNITDSQPLVSASQEEPVEDYSEEDEDYEDEEPEEYAEEKEQEPIPAKAPGKQSSEVDKVKQSNPKEEEVRSRPLETVPSKMHSAPAATTNEHRPQPEFNKLNSFLKRQLPNRIEEPVESKLQKRRDMYQPAASENQHQPEYERAQIKVYRGPADDKSKFAPYGYWVREPANPH